MWTHFVKGVAIANIETLSDYQQSRCQEKINDNVGDFLIVYFDHLPWYFSRPLVLYSFFLGTLFTLINGCSFDQLSPTKRQVYFAKLKLIPLFSMLNKFIRAIAFLRFFDYPLTESNLTKNELQSISIASK